MLAHAGIDCKPKAPNHVFRACRGIIRIYWSAGVSAIMSEMKPCRDNSGAMMKAKKNGRQGCLPTPVGKARKDDAYDEMHRGSQRNHDDWDDGNRDRTMPCKHEGDGRDRCDGKCHQAA